MSPRQLFGIGIGVIAIAAAGSYGFSALREGQVSAPALQAAVVQQPATDTIQPPAPSTTKGSGSVQAPVVERQLPGSEAQVQLSFAPIVKAVTPSVVNVYATTLTRQTTSPFANDPFFQRFFGGRQMFEQRPRESQSLGSGVIVDASGVILTNSHVVHGATDVRISSSDGREYSVDIVLDDAKTDLAVLKVKDVGGHTFTALKFADSDLLQVGDLVLAIGNPFGVGQTVTSGIVSALARTGVESNNYEFFIQTDAAINPGNSGGALVDMNGNLIGINTAIFSQSGGSVGIGFAIPANMARVVADAGVRGGRIVRPWFGARTQEVSADLADSLGLDRPRGALITEIAPDGPAEKAGFAVGDVILSVDGVEVTQPSAFDYRLATKPVGQSADIVFERDRSQKSIKLVLEAAPGANGEGVVTIDGDTRFSGTSVETLNPAVADELGLAFNAKGIVVKSVAPGSPANRMGLMAGDIILNINGQDMTDAEAFKALVSKRADGWQIVLQRDGQVFRSFVSG
jgi:Do/DeqQ family serine protease